MPVIGFFSAACPRPGRAGRISSFGRGLSEIGFVVGKDVAIDVRMAEGEYDRLPSHGCRSREPPREFNRSTCSLRRRSPQKQRPRQFLIVFVVALDPVERRSGHQP